MRMWKKVSRRRILSAVMLVESRSTGCGGGVSGVGGRYVIDAYQMKSLQVLNNEGTLYTYIRG